MENYLVSEEKKIKMQTEVRCFNCKSSEKPLIKHMAKESDEYEGYTYDLLFCQTCLDNIKPIIDLNLMNYELKSELFQKEEMKR